MNQDGQEIPFSTNYKNIAVSLSGGADSALLAYLLSSYSTNTTIHCISHTRMWKLRPWQMYDSLNVFQWLNARFSNLKFIRHTNFIAPELEYGNIGPSLIDEYGKNVSGDNIQIRAYSEFVCYHNNIEAYYNAVTRNPRNVNFTGMIEREIEKNDANKHLEATTHMGVDVFHPFRFLDKSWVVKQYKDLDIMDLFELTRSCEGNFEGLTYETYTPGQYVPLCNECFWCKERTWAIEQNK